MKNQADYFNWQMLGSGLASHDPVEYIKELRDSGALKNVLPEVNSLFGVPQTEKYHPEIDTGIHTLMTLKRASELSDDVAVRYAALVHDLGKGLTDPSEWPKHHGHEESGVEPVLNIAKRLNVPLEITDLAVTVARYHLHAHRSLEMRPGKLVKLFEDVNAFENPYKFEQFVMAVQADAQGRLGMEDKPYPQADFLRSLFAVTKDFESDDDDPRFKDKQIMAVAKAKRDYEITQFIQLDKNID